MKTARWAVLALLLSVVAGCDDPAPTKVHPPATSTIPSSTSSPTPPASAMASASSAATQSSPPEPTETIVASQDEQKYLLKLEEIAPELTESTVEALDLGHGICTRRLSGWDDAMLSAWVQTVALSGDAFTRTSLNIDQANNIVAAAGGYLCGG